MMLDSTLGTSLVEGRTLGGFWLVVSHIATVSTFTPPVGDKIHLLFCFPD